MHDTCFQINNNGYSKCPNCGSIGSMMTYKKNNSCIPGQCVLSG